MPSNDIAMVPTTEDPAHSSTKKGVMKHNFMPFDEVKKIASIFNSFATKKTFSTSLFNIALIATNIAQIKQLAAPSGGRKPNWSAINIVCLVFVCLSLFLQFIVAFVLAFLAKQGEFIDDDARNRLIRSNNFATILVLIISVINIFISVFLSN
jgi:ABC-type sugar transport system permease subunit